MSEDTNVDTNVESTAADDVATMVNDVDYGFVLDKYKAEGRSDQDAAFEQAKAYPELQKQFGSFTGAPENYEFTLSDELKEAGSDFGTDAPEFEELAELAKDLNMSQDGFNKMAEVFAMRDIAEQEAHTELLNDEMKKLGDNATGRLQNLSKWAIANLPNDLQESFNELAVSAGAVQALESIISMTRGAPMEPNIPAAPGISEADVRAAHNEINEQGQRKYDVDPDHRAKVEKMYKQIYKGDFNTQVG